MRWENLSVVADDSPEQLAARAAPPLPLALPNAVVRTFDTPGFAGMTFYEVRARSIINRVPSASRVPFEWTINPYRGCTHACRYCLAGETPILLADGRTRRLADLRIGDAIYGTVQVGGFRRFVVTRVLDHWSTVRPAYRVVLADGTELIASGDHRFLTDRGWKHVTGSMSGSGRRPYLTPAVTLMGTGRFAEAPKDSAEYRAGYLCGIIRGDGHLAIHRYPFGVVHQFRMALADFEALERARGYLASFGVEAAEFDFSPASERRRAMRGIRAARSDAVAAVADLIRWPLAPTDDWRKGFLAGVFDAEGSRSRHVLRIANCDEAILRQTAAALASLRFDTVLEDRRLPNGFRTLRIRGGLSEHLRFRHLTDPAITRKWEFTGAAVKTGVDLRVVSVEPLGLRLPLFDITTTTGDFIADGVVSHNCFARNTHTYLDLDAGQDFDSKVVVKVNAGTLLRRELAAPKWRGEHIAMGTNVDCYQRAEGRYKLMREIIAALRDFANPFSILTKGTLILRDLDLLRQAAEVTNVGVSFSVGAVDEAMWRAAEPGTPSPRRRLDAVRTLTEAGFRVGVLMAPILPGLTDTDESIEATVAAIAASGAVSVTPLPLHLRKGAREWYSAWLAGAFPHLVPRYRELYRGGSYLPRSYQEDVTSRVRAAARRHGIGGSSAGQARQVEPPPRPPEPEQLTLL